MKNTLFFELDRPARLIRRRARRLITLIRWRRFSFGSSPILFANSFPKSGTHLLTQIMQGFSRLGLAVDAGLPAIVTYDGFTGRHRSQTEIIKDLRQLLPGDISYGHVHAFSLAVRMLSTHGFASYFIVRDPRDVVVSHVHYIAEMAPNHIHHRYYHEILQTFEQRLQASICGVSVDELQKASNTRVLEPLPDILSRFAPYLGWLELPEVLTIRYEDFITDRLFALGKVFDHAVKRGFQHIYSREQAIKTLEDAIDPQRSPTFRSGKIGGWKAAFNAHHHQLFLEVSGDLLKRLGYDDFS